MAGSTGFLTTHVLDTARGVPAAGIRVTLHRLTGMGRDWLAEMVTNDDGRTESPILPEESFAPGSYELEFDVGQYLNRLEIETGNPRFLDIVPIRFGISDADVHYHVPLLVSPYGYATYRGS
ncbi:hydroxyisourate hydrolase [Maritimibacter sp. 55A14]|uniref:hydroxyisourate hydrolase n=1 Tax=Maritimibacter sp. 55A14 TaxID=2174844 RepID=UPI000D61B473|nr:hydroxyisourate hydrolase [Maritimibacter sp. 55A14]PWE30603.1 hydroxyisourate hydrolase [Maritimibacter sp. 55A14]